MKHTIHSVKQLLSILLLTFSLVGLCPVVSADDTINVNTATVEQLASALNGIGEKRAKAIVKYRQSNGTFKSLADLTAVKGVGDKVLEKNKAKIRFK